ncbi:hypothetical protein SAY87_026681 [Trapa incisa]|uniref:Uncharacterized protein n=1 Tax=Trapa incisa TaxID=236973 RepID=A0AAN7H444_9MYRT|nr:hypothetical protein SAY87_026681 [Trapa incisa]
MIYMAFLFGFCRTLLVILQFFFILNVCKDYGQSDELGTFVTDGLNCSLEYTNLFYIWRLMNSITLFESDRASNFTFYQSVENEERFQEGGGGGVSVALVSLKLSKAMPFFFSI